jgi:hypothetical protein
MMNKFLLQGILLPGLTAAMLATPFVERQSAAQLITQDVAAINKTDAISYRLLFRMAAEYKQLADDATANHQDKSHFRRILAVRLEMSSDDAVSLERIAINCQNELAPLRARSLSIIREFRARFSGSIVTAGMDTSPPPELAILQAQEDSIILRHRDMLRNAMKEEDFQRSEKKVREMLSGAIMSAQPGTLNTVEGAR